jgi:MFS family permease
VRALEALNFFMADVQAGVGPFLGVFLLMRGWESGAIGSVMTIGGIAGMLTTTAAGAIVDATHRKRSFVIFAAALSMAASAIVLMSQAFWAISLSQTVAAIAGSALAPAAVGITLGIVGQNGFNRQNGRNQAFNHAGNMAGAAAAGLFGAYFGLPGVFILAIAFGAFTIGSTLFIPAAAIDHRAARGQALPEEAKPIRTFRVLYECKPLLILSAALALFHLGNAAMLPLYGLAISAVHQGDAAELVALTIVVAQGVMIAASLIAMRMADASGYWLVILISFVALPIRAVVASIFITEWGVFPVQFLDGVGAGLQSVAVPGMIAWLLNGTGRVNLGQGAVMTVQGAGAASSPAIGGWIAQWLGYRVSFLALGAFALLSVALWLICRPILRGADRPAPA